MREAKGIMCDSCTKMECERGYPDGIPAYCMATGYRSILEGTKRQYSAPDDMKIYVAAVKVVSAGYEKWPRVQEAIEFARELKLKKIGFASCVALVRELGMISELFTGAGLTVVSVSCQIGRVPPEERGVTEDITNLKGSLCNPIAQAEILNSEGTELNFLLGLCLGHDILFTKHSKAPVSTLIVKDRVTGHNPAAALYSAFHRRALWKLYCGKDIGWQG